jgi:CMP-N-acetylneuraminic acid synthetase
VDTDSPLIQQELSKYFPEVIVLPRPERLCADTIPMNEILMYDTDQVSADLYLQTHSTNPLLKSHTISESIRYFRKNSPQFDSLFSVTRLQTRLWDKDGLPINHDPDVLLQTQDLPPIYEENSCIYLFTAENLKNRGNRMGERPLMFEMNPEEALDIDEERDFLIADLLMKNRLQG